MLEAITDFWRPTKKSPTQEKARIADLQIGTVISFGFMPQMVLSSKKLLVSSVNTYQFGADVLTSFVISRGKDYNKSSDIPTDVSMIVADAQGEQYLAISRRLSGAERAKLFAENAVKDVVSKDDFTKLVCMDNVPELKGWLVSEYKREIHGMRGFFHKGDLRSGNDKLRSGDEFQYILLGSDSNEHALEIEAYSDGRIDVYATIYRRISDVVEVIQPLSSMQQKADVKLVAQNNEATPLAKALLAPIGSSEALSPVIVLPPKGDKTDKAEVEKPASEKREATEAKVDVPEEMKSEEIKIEPKTEAQSEKKPEIIKLEELPLPQLTATPLEPAIEKVEIKELEKLIEEKNDMIITSTPTLTTENKSFGSNGHDYNGVAGTISSVEKMEVKTVNKTVNGMDAESISCDLKVANQIIDEAIRSEMRLSDVVRRIIELPVAHQEAVQIPLTLSDDDYSLLAIRYGISALDRNAIKARIIQDLGDFSGSKK
jgi:hypothetical protein